MFSLLKPSLIQDRANGHWPRGMTMFFPLVSDLSPDAGAGGDIVVTRPTEKWQQVSASGVTRFGNDELLPTTEFFGYSAGGLLVESDPVGNAMGWSDISAWGTSNCVITAGVTDPTGTPNSAYLLTPSADGGYVYQAVGTNCANKNVFNSCWIRRRGGLAGSHTGGIIIADSNLAIFVDKPITVTSAWQPVFNEATGAAGSGLAVIAIKPSVAQDAVDVWLPFIKVFPNSTVASILSSGTPATRGSDVCTYDCSSDVDGSKGTFYMTATPMFTPADGIKRYLLNIFDMDGAGTGLYLRKETNNKLYLSYGPRSTSGYALSGANFARGSTHRIAFSYSAAGMSLYLNGTEVDTAAAFVPGAAALDAGCRMRFDDGAGAFLPGAIISHIRYWPKVLTATEMARITR